MEKIFKEALPLLSGALTGGIPGLAIAAAGKLASYFGFSDASVEGVKKAMNGLSPDQILAAKKLDQEFALENRRLDNESKLIDYTNQKDLLNADVTDRASARAANTVTGSQDIFVKCLAVIIISGGFYILGKVLFGGVAVNVSDMVAGMILGFIIQSVASPIQYFFGSSSGSVAKTNIMAKKE